MNRRNVLLAGAALWLPWLTPAGAAEDAPPPGPTEAALPVAISARDKNVRYTGRFDASDPAGPRCSWSASAVTVRFSGSAINARLHDTGENDRYEVVVDGKPAGTLKLTAGSHLYRVFSSVEGAGEHTVELVKRTEGFFGVTRFEGFQLSEGGKLLPPPPRPKRRIEVVGDSISCGYGNEAPDQKAKFSPDTENAYLTYGAIAARELGAEYTCVAWSGRQMWPKNTMDEVYGRALAADENSRWDFRRWTPDVVVVTLGTNDFAGGAPDRAGWVKGYRAFLAHVRANYPRAAVYCATSPMMWGDPRTVIQGYLEQVVAEERAAGHKSVRLLEFATQDAADGFGADWHPSVKTQQKMAAKLSAVLQADLGWEPAGKSAR